MHCKNIVSAWHVNIITKINNITNYLLTVTIEAYLFILCFVFTFMLAQVDPWHTHKWQDASRYTPIQNNGKERISFKGLVRCVHDFFALHF